MTSRRTATERTSWIPQELHHYGQYFRSEPAASTQGSISTGTPPLCRLQKSIWLNWVECHASSLVEKRIGGNYVEINKEANRGCLTDGVHWRRPQISRRRKAGDPLLSKLVNVCHDMVFRKLNWEGEISVNSGRLNPLRLPENVVLIASSTREINEMLQKLS